MRKHSFKTQSDSDDVFEPLGKKTKVEIPMCGNLQQYFTEHLQKPFSEHESDDEKIQKKESTHEEIAAPETDSELSTDSEKEKNNNDLTVLYVQGQAYAEQNSKEADLSVLIAHLQEHSIFLQLPRANQLAFLMGDRDCQIRIGLHREGAFTSEEKQFCHWSARWGIDNYHSRHLKKTLSPFFFDTAVSLPIKYVKYYDVWKAITHQIQKILDKRLQEFKDKRVKNESNGWIIIDL